MFTNNKAQRIALADLPAFVKTLTEAEGEKIKGGFWLGNPPNLKDPLNHKEWEPGYLEIVIKNGGKMW